MITLFDRSYHGFLPAICSVVSACGEFSACFAYILLSKTLFRIRIVMILRFFIKKIHRLEAHFLSRWDFSTRLTLHMGTFAIICHFHTLYMLYFTSKVPSWLWGVWVYCVVHVSRGCIRCRRRQNTTAQPRTMTRWKLGHRGIIASLWDSSNSCDINDTGVFTAGWRLLKQPLMGVI